VSKLSALMLAVGVAAAVWVGLSIGKPEFNQVWLVGQGLLSALKIEGREILSGAAGIAVWVAALHFPERPKHIWFRRSSARRFAQ
jgi:hypothetical protein